MLLCYLVTHHSARAQVQVVEGVWQWPDQGLNLYDPNGDTFGGAYVFDLLPYGDKLIVGGIFHYAGGIEARNLAAWDGGAWSVLGENDPNGTVRVLLEADGALYVGGGLRYVGELLVNGLARWDGQSWAALGNGPSQGVFALAWWDDGAGPTIYAGGMLGNARIRKWTGSAWVSVGGGCDLDVNALAVFDDGTGPALYAGGWFDHCGGVATSRIAKWDGLAWTPLGQGITDDNGFVNALAVYDDGTGPALYAGGQFNEIDGMPIDSLARGGGKSWSPVGNPGLVPQAFVWQLRVVDDGTGQVLMMAAGKVQKWDGKTWTRYMPQPGPMITAAVFPGPDGPKTLHVGGEIPLNIGEPPQQIRVNIARFDGPTAGGAACGDFDGDGMVTQADLGILLANFDCTGNPGDCPGDTDNDGDVDQSDLGTLLAHFGQECG